MNKSRLVGAVYACLLLLPINAYADLEQLIPEVSVSKFQLHADGNITYLTDAGVLARTNYGSIFSGGFGSSPELHSLAINYAGDVAYSTNNGGTYTNTGALINTSPLQLKLFDSSTDLTTTVAEEDLNGVPSSYLDIPGFGTVSYGMDVFGITTGKKITFSAGRTLTYDTNSQIDTSVTGIYTVTETGGPVTTLATVGLNQDIIPAVAGGAGPKPNSNGDMVFSLNSLSTDEDGNLASIGELKRSAGGVAAVSVFAGIYQPAPDGNGLMVSPFSPEFGRLTNANEYIFSTKLTATSGGQSDDSGIYSVNGAGFTQLVREGDALSGGGFMGAIRDNALLSFTQDDGVIFSSRVTGTTADGAGRLYKFSNGQLMELARTGQALPDGSEVIQNLYAVGQVQSERDDLALFTASIPSGFNNETVLLLTDGTDTVEVARDSSLAFGGVRPRQVNINEYGEVAFKSSGLIYRYSPDLTFKNNVSGQWDGTGNWTFGLTPGARNTVSIDDAIGSAITGPTSDTAVKAVRVGVSGNTNSLTLGTGNLIVGSEVVVGENSQINLNGKAITVGDGTPETSADTMRVYAGGTLGGSGTIIGDVVNAGGTIGPGFSPGTLTIDGSYTHEAGSILDIEIWGDTEGLFDVLNVIGDMTFENGSIINVIFGNDYALQTGEVFDLTDYITATGVISADFSEAQISILGLEEGFSYTTAFTTNSFSLTALNDGVPLSTSAVPIPTALWLFGSGLLGLIGIAKRKKAT